MLANGEALGVSVETLPELSEPVADREGSTEAVPAPPPTSGEADTV